MRKILIAALIASTGVLSGCLDGALTPEAEPLLPADSRNLINSMVFQKQEATGLCFGMVNMTKVSTSGSVSGSMTITQVDCSLIPANLIRN